MKTWTALITVLALSPFSVAAVNSNTEAQHPSVVCQTCNVNSSIEAIKSVSNELVKLSSNGDEEPAPRTTDERVVIDRYSEEFKRLNAIGFVTHIKQKFNGTGFMVSPCLVLTNNHVAFDEVDKETPELGKDLYFSVGQTGSKTRPFKYQKVKGKVIAFNSNYDGTTQATGFDWTIIKVNKVKNEDENFVNLGDEVGFIKIVQASPERMVKQKKLITAGYPGSKGIKENYSNLYADLNCKIYSDSGMGYVYHTCQATGGQSGSPILAKGKDGNHYVISMISGKAKTNDGLDRSQNEKNSKFSVSLHSGSDYNFVTEGDKIKAAIEANKCD